MAREFPAIAPSIEWTAHTDVGRVRKNNEDAFLCLEFDSNEVRYLGKTGSTSLQSVDCVFAVSDGMGGANAGEFASRIAVDQITRLLPRTFSQKATGLSAGFSDILTELIGGIHRTITNMGRSYEECGGMGATLSLCWLTPGWMFYAHIGDTRIYYMDAASGQLRQVTQDDTHVGWLLRSGRINEREARSHPRKNALSKALGAGHQFVDPQVGAIGYESGDAFFLCTDGVVDGLSDRQITRIVFDPETAEAQLPEAPRVVKAAVEQSGRDNTTAMWIKVM